MHQNFNQHPHLVQKISGRWSQQEKRAFEEGLKIHGRGRWVLFLPIIPTKTQLQIRQVSIFPHVSITVPTFLLFPIIKLPIPNQPETDAYSSHSHSLPFCIYIFLFVIFTACLCLL